MIILTRLVWNQNRTFLLLWRLCIAQYSVYEQATMCMYESKRRDIVKIGIQMCLRFPWYFQAYKRLVLLSIKISSNYVYLVWLQLPSSVVMEDVHKRELHSTECLAWRKDRREETVSRVSRIVVKCLIVVGGSWHYLSNILASMEACFQPSTHRSLVFEVAWSLGHGARKMRKHSSNRPHVGGKD